jgi:hypothetical protein
MRLNFDFGFHTNFNTFKPIYQWYKSLNTYKAIESELIVVDPLRHLLGFKFEWTTESSKVDHWGIELELTIIGLMWNVHWYDGRHSHQD